MKENANQQTGEGNAPRDVGRTVPATDFVREACNNYESVKVQRDELLAVCKLVHRSYINCADVTFVQPHVMKQVVAAIAKAEGSKQ